MAKKIDKNTAIAALIVNLILPGIGSMIGGKTGSGIAQLVVSILGVIFSLTIIGMVIGIPLMLIGWIWALVTGITLVSGAK